MHRVLRTLILSDLFIVGSFGLIQPIFSIFLLQGLTDSSVFGIGIALAIQLLTKAIFQILVGKWDDEERGNRRELWTLLVGSVLIALTPFGYAAAHSMVQICFIQALYGIGGALSFPSWRIMFTRYSNQEREGYEWSVYDTIISLATAVTAAVGAYIAEMYSFRYLFVFVGFLSLVGTAFIVTIFKNEFTTLPSWGRLMTEPVRARKRTNRVKKTKYARVRAS